ncbi:MAG TPA: viroplasmin family protein [Methylomirabilota bacterium]
MAKARVYVVTAPERIRGIYASWPDCAAAVKGVSGARYQAVASREQAEAMLRGEGTEVEPGLYAFVDGNHLGGVGVVIVERAADGDPEIVEAVGLTVDQVFAGAGVRSLSTPPAVRAALERLRNVLAELAALHLALRLLPEGAAVTVVHDYEGVGAWLEGRWQAKDPLIAEIVAACRDLIGRRRLAVRFRHQRGHAAAWAGRDDFAHFNARADALASEAATER